MGKKQKQPSENVRTDDLVNYANELTNWLKEGHGQLNEAESLRVRQCLSDLACSETFIVGYGENGFPVRTPVYEAFSRLHAAFCLRQFPTFGGKYTPR